MIRTYLEFRYLGGDNMKKRKITKNVRKEEEKFSQKSYEDLSKLDKNLSYQVDSDENAYQVEVNIVEKNEKFIQLLIAVDDGAIFRGRVPLSTSVVVHKKQENNA